MSRVELNKEKWKLQKLIEDIVCLYPYLSAPTIADFNHCIRLKIKEIDTKLNHTDDGNFKPEYKTK